MKHRTEQVYDDEMNPLVAQLIAIAKREGIPLFVSAGMLNPDGEVLFCTTLLPDEAGILPGATNRHGLALQIIRGDERFDRVEAMQITRYHPGQENPPEPGCTGCGTTGVPLDIVDDNSRLCGTCCKRQAAGS